MTRLYTTQLQAGLGLIEETKILLDLWSPGMTTPALQQLALESGRFPKVTARRLRNVISECFAPRYLSAAGTPAASHLRILSPATSSAELIQFFLLFTCRANLILGDFIRQVYWERYASGHSEVANDDAERFVRRALDDGKTVKRWSESTVRRVSVYLTGCCADYGLLDRGQKSVRRILPCRITPKVAIYLAYDLHFSGLGDNSLMGHADWQLFGFSSDEVREELKRLSLKGYFIMQSAGDVTRISWKHKTMEELCDVLAQG